MVLMISHQTPNALQPTCTCCNSGPHKTIQEASHSLWLLLDTTDGLEVSSIQVLRLLQECASVVFKRAQQGCRSGSSNSKMFQDARNRTSECVTAVPLLSTLGYITKVKVDMLRQRLKHAPECSPRILC